MKIQQFGSALWLQSCYFSPVCGWLIGAARGDFKNKRENGKEEDSPKNLKLDYDGEYTWIKGKVNGDYVYGIQRPSGDYDYEVRYKAGQKILAYFEAKDRNYLTRILRERKLRELEPAIWYLFATDNPQHLNIADWWSQKLTLPTEKLDKLLKDAEVAEKLRKEQEEMEIKWQKQLIEDARVALKVFTQVREKIRQEKQKRDNEAKPYLVVRGPSTLKKEDVEKQLTPIPPVASIASSVDSNLTLNRKFIDLGNNFRAKLSLSFLNDCNKSKAELDRRSDITSPLNGRKAELNSALAKEKATEQTLREKNVILSDDKLAKERARKKSQERTKSPDGLETIGRVDKCRLG